MMHFIPRYLLGRYTYIHRSRTSKLQNMKGIKNLLPSIAAGLNTQIQKLSSFCGSHEEPKNNLAAILYKPKDLRLENIPIPEINDDEVLLRMDCVGICGSDVHYYMTGSCGDFKMTKPMVMGHEAAGTVDKKGSKVKNLKVGDRVAIEPGVPCRYCDFCKTGRYHLCPEMRFCATPPYDGNLCQYFKHPADFCFKLPKHMTMEEGCLLEPLSVAVHSCLRGGVRAGDNVLVLGAGPIGLVTLLTAKAMGASQVMITDINQPRLDFAKSVLKADHTLLVKKDAKEDDMVRCIHSSLGAAPDVSIDACGTESVVRIAMLATKSGGKAVMVGMGDQNIRVPLAGAVAREVDVRGIFRYVNEYPIALALVASGKVNVKPLVTHHFDIKDTVKAYKFSHSGAGIKTIIHIKPYDKKSSSVTKC